MNNEVRQEVSKLSNAQLSVLLRWAFQKGLKHAVALIEGDMTVPEPWALAVNGEVYVKDYADDTAYLLDDIVSGRV